MRVHSLLLRTTWTLLTPSTPLIPVLSVRDRITPLSTIILGFEGIPDDLIEFGVYDLLDSSDRDLVILQFARMETSDSVRGDDASKGS